LNRVDNHVILVKLVFLVLLVYTKSNTHPFSFSQNSLVHFSRAMASANRFRSRSVSKLKGSLIQSHLQVKGQLC